MTAEGKRETLVDKWLRALKNHPVTAAIMVMAVCITGAGTFYKALPEQWRCVGCWFSADATDGLPNNGWVHAGYLSRTNTNNWSQPAKVKVVRRSDAYDRPYPIRDGDIVQPLMPLPQVIVNYANTKEGNVLTAPPELVRSIDPKRDFTGRKVDPEHRYLVNDVSVMAFPGHDYVVWLRLTPWTAND